MHAEDLRLLPKIAPPSLEWSCRTRSGPTGFDQNGEAMFRQASLLPAHASQIEPFLSGPESFERGFR